MKAGTRTLLHPYSLQHPLFTTASMRQQPRWISTDKRIHKTYPYNGTVFRLKESFGTFYNMDETCKHHAKTEISQTQKNKYCRISLR